MPKNKHKPGKFSGHQTDTASKLLNTEVPTRQLNNSSVGSDLILENSDMNYGYFYNKLYYSNFQSFDNTEKKQEEYTRLLNNKLLAKNKVYRSNNSEIYSHNFPLTVVYPGLVAGTGYGHEAKLKGEAKLGMHFNYTNGMPCIPGSSVKGVLRNAFITYPEFVVEILKKIDPQTTFVSKNEIKKLENSIFGNDENKNQSIYSSDIFFDAEAIEKNSKKHIFDMDAITDHSNRDPIYEKSLLKNPLPIAFLKISSGVKIQFNFKLTDINLPADFKLELFKQIILTLGIGAKTNVGYGQFN